MMAEQAWSHSALTAFETCPKKYWMERAAPKGIRLPYVEGDAARWGNYVHKAFEDYVRLGKDLPVELSSFRVMLDLLKASGSQLYCEIELPVRKDFTLTEWFAKDVWLRVKLDLLVRKGNKALIIDYKTGKMKDEWDQLRLAAALVMTIWPEITEVDIAFVWVGDKQITKEAVQKDEVAAIWADYFTRLQPFQAAFNKQEFSPKKNGLCRKFCPVTSCPHHGC